MKHQHVQTRQVADDALTRAADVGGASAGVIVKTGQTTLVAGVGPSVAVPSITANSVVLYDIAAANASTTLGIPEAVITPGVGFSTVSLQLAAPSTTQTGDLSTYRYAVINPL